MALVSHFNLRTGGSAAVLQATSAGPFSALKLALPMSGQEEGSGFPVRGLRPLQGTAFPGAR